MRKTAILMSVITAVFAVGMLITQIAVAQETTPGTQPQAGWGIGVPIPFNERITGSEPIATVTGKIVKIGKLKGFKDSLQMTIKATEPFRQWDVWMGPRWFIVNQKVKFNMGDEVEVRGLQFKPDIIIASEISKGDMTMMLRSENDGMPNWECCVPRVHKEEGGSK